MDCIVN